MTDLYFAFPSGPAWLRDLYLSPTWGAVVCVVLAAVGLFFALWWLSKRG